MHFKTSHEHDFTMVYLFSRYILFKFFNAFSDALALATADYTPIFSPMIKYVPENYIFNTIIKLYGI